MPVKTRIVRHNGQLMIDIGGTLHSALSFKSFRPNPVNITEMYTAGVRLFDVLSSGILCGLGVPYSRFGESWVGEYEYDFAPIDRQMEMFLEHAPEGYFAPMFQIDTRPWYLAQHPEAPNSFTHLSQIAGDAGFRKAAAAWGAGVQPLPGFPGAEPLGRRRRRHSSVYRITAQRACGAKPARR